MRLANLSTELLNTFTIVIKVGGFNRAAEYLNKTQSTISQQIKKLESEVGVALFKKQGRQQVLTPSGEIFLGYAKRMLALQSDSLFAIRQTMLSDKIHIGVSHSLSEGLLTEVLVQFSQAYPEIRLCVETGFSDSIIKHYHQKKYDLTLTLEQNTTEGTVLAEQEIVWIGKQDFQWDKSRALPLASYQAPCQFREFSIKSLEQAHLPWRMVYITNSLSSLMAAVSAGLAVTVRTNATITENTEIITHRLRLPTLPKMKIVLRNRSLQQASELLVNRLKEVDLKAL